MPALRTETPLGTFHTATVWIDADDFSVKNLTIANSAIRLGRPWRLRSTETESGSATAGFWAGRIQYW